MMLAVAISICISLAPIPRAWNVSRTPRRIQPEWLRPSPITYRPPNPIVLPAKTPTTSNFFAQAMLASQVWSSSIEANGPLAEA